MVFKVSRVWLDALAREAIATEAASRRFRETGGGLFGYEVGDDTVIVRVLPPGPRAQHKRTRLIPHHGDVQADIDSVFEESSGALSYLGDWHSHPRGSNEPSQVDTGNAAKMAAERAAEVPRPLVLIQATKPFRIHVAIAALGAFRWSTEGRRLECCELIVVPVEASESGLDKA
jgi:integrative and conjugative element protein (TIGR02256 family)